MTVIKTTRVWDGITLNEFTDTSTGSITIKSTSGVTLASSVDNTWVIEDLTSLTRLYNNAKFGSTIQTELTEAQVKKEFFNNGIKLFNEDRASVLNNTSNYNSNTESDNNRDAFFVKKIPGIVQPTTRRSITSEGGSTSISSFGVEPQTSADASNFSVRSLGKKDKSVSKSKSLRYPLGVLPDLDYDFVTFQAYDYKTKSGQLAVQDAEDRVGDPVGAMITLPIVGNITESNSVDWGGDSMNRIQELGAGFAMKAIQAGGEASLEKLGEAFTDAKNKIAEMAKDANTGPAIAAYFAGQAVGANIQARATGAVLNNNLELLFNGPKLRSFNFNFKLRPRFKEESDQIREIIRTFKENMSPKRSTSNLFLETPNVFKIKYTFGGEKDQHPYMNKIKPCALQAFNVNYTPDGSYMTYADGGLTGYDISLTFGEILPIYFDDHEDTADSMSF